MTFIIAEIGSNWKTDQDLFLSIAEAKRCGADAVKFQAFSHYDLYGSSDASWQANQYALKWNNIPLLKRECDRVGIEFMCTAFNHELVPTLDPYVNYHKVASSNMMDLKLLKALRDTGKTVFLSTGGWKMDQVITAMTYLEPHQGIPLYCQPDYSGNINPDLRCISLLKEEFEVAGFSDHSTDSSYTGWAAANTYGADVIEKHVNFTDHRDTPDASFALDGGKFRKYVLNIKDQYEPELPVRFHDMELHHYARPVVTRDCLAGEPVDYRYMRVHKPSIYRDHGLDFEGCRAARDLTAGDVLDKAAII